MNKAQLEKIRAKIAEIDLIIQEDMEGFESLNTAFEQFKRSVENYLRDIVWNEYVKTKETQSPSP